MTATSDAPAVIEVDGWELWQRPYSTVAHALRPGHAVAPCHQPVPRASARPPKPGTPVCRRCASVMAGTHVTPTPRSIP